MRVEEEQMNVEAMALQTMFQKAHHQPLGVLRKAHHQPVGVLRKAHHQQVGVLRKAHQRLWKAQGEMLQKAQQVGMLRKAQGEMLQKAQGDNSKASMILSLIHI